MTVVNLSALFESQSFYDIVGELFDELDDSYKDLIEKKLGNVSEEGLSKEGGFYSDFSKLL
jgi:hypothetical protein